MIIILVVEFSGNNLGSRIHDNNLSNSVHDNNLGSRI